MGRYPYPDPNDEVQELGYWELMQYITHKESPKLPNDFSPEFQNFVSILLRKQGGTRSSATELMKHPFIVKFEKIDPKHLRRWIKTIN